MIPVFMAIASLLQQKKAQNDADNKQLNNSLNLGQNNNSINQVQVPQNNNLGNNAMGLLGSLFNKK